MEFTTRNLLKNASYSAKQYNRFVHYMTLINLAKGVVSNSVNVESIKALEKLHYKIDPLTDYIINIFDYDMYIKDGEPSIIYVVETSSKRCVGTLAVDLSGENIQLSANADDMIIGDDFKVVIE
ncbi:ORF-138 [Agrotis segetum nucleopolyhedrovirus A]|uniref:ORF-138 n=1 Tax=Agrotis segetum nuclear polyhedrosis virus TaxID=1962501 RepID=Q287D4_NPVAS|nr:ORF-138 [Agrotis segetum nucleopolyhedrovirus A]AAZ38304.1 ORF-138 [Agrotis segetum nucleopolyhedrovirus A]